jgi:hypothetical protein
VNKGALWREIARRNPRIVTGEPPIAFTPAGFRKAFDLIWDTAERHGVGADDADEAGPARNPGNDAGLRELMGMMGMRS